MGDFNKNRISRPYSQGLKIPRDYNILRRVIILIYSTNETRLLIALARLDFDYNDLVTRELINTVDWNKLIKLIMNHKLILIVHRNINVLLENIKDFVIPVEILTKFNDLVKGIRVLMKLKQLEFDNIIAAFHENKIKAVILKGISLNNIYNGLRFYDDFDLLINLKDFKAVHSILSDLQYQFVNDADDSEENILYGAEQSLYSVGDYFKATNNITFSIDLHKADDFDFYNLRTMYNDSVVDIQNNFNHLNIVDCFIYACYHALHHYPKVICMRLGNELASLKDYMDIREIYLYIKRNKLLDQLYERIEQLRCKCIINDILALTERLYGEFCKKNNIITCYESIIHDCNNKYVTSCFERRLFYPEIEKEVIDSYYRKKNKDVEETEYYKCFYFDNNQFLDYNNPIFWDSNKHYDSGDDTIFDEPYGISHNNDRLKFFFSFAWDNNNLIIRIIMHQKENNFGSEDFYNPIQDSIKFIFNDDWDTHFTLQIKKNSYNHILFMENNNVYQLKQIEDSATHVDVCTDYYTIVTTIPWKYTNMLPMNGMVIDFYFNIIIYNRHYYSTNTYVHNTAEFKSLQLLS